MLLTISYAQRLEPTKGTQYCVLLGGWEDVTQFNVEFARKRLGVAMKFVLPFAFWFGAIPGTILASDNPEAPSVPPAICADCHDKDGASTEPDVPIIGGISALSIEEQLFAFRDRAIPCSTTHYRAGAPDRPTTDMCQISADLTDDEIVRIAAFYASKPFVPAKQQPDPEKAARGKQIHNNLGCVLCHTQGGSDPADDASILAGQWMDYLTTALINFRDGKIWMQEDMQSQLQNLTDHDIEALVHFYGREGSRHESN